MGKNKIAFLSDMLNHDSQLAAWFYLLGVTPEQFETVFLRPEHRKIHEQVSSYHRYAVHLRKVILSLNDDDVHGFIKIPKNPCDSLSYGYLYRPADKTYLNISYNGVDGISIGNGDRRLLGGIPPVEMHPELAGNWQFIDKNQRDILFQWATCKDLSKSAINVKFERIVDETLTDDRLDFLVNIAIQHPGEKWQHHSVYDSLCDWGWTREEAKSLTENLP